MKPHRHRRNREDSMLLCGQILAPLMDNIGEIPEGHILPKMTIIQVKTS